MTKRTIMPEPVLFENMSPVMFYSATSILYIVIILGGLFITNLEVIFEFITAFSLTFLDFIWPGSQEKPGRKNKWTVFS